MGDDLNEIGTATPATDLLEERGLAEDAAILRAAPGRAALLEQAVGLLEELVRERAGDWQNDPDPEDPDFAPALAVIAGARGETPRQSLDRIHPPRPVDEPDDAEARLLADSSARLGLRVVLLGQDGVILGDCAPAWTGRPGEFRATVTMGGILRAVEVRDAAGIALFVQTLDRPEPVLPGDMYSGRIDIEG